LAHGFKIGGSVEGVSSPQQKRNEVAGYIASSDIEAASEVVEHSAFVDGDDMCNTISRVNDHTR